VSQSLGRNQVRAGSLVGPVASRVIARKKTLVSITGRGTASGSATLLARYGKRDLKWFITGETAHEGDVVARWPEYLICEGERGRGADKP
jgi:hypothetical protein